MATANTALRVSELDFDSIRTNLKNYLNNQSEFSDYDFEGSGMSVLLDVLAYNTHYMAYYLNMVGNEMFLDTAQLRPSILSHAKQIGYIPSSMKGSEASVNVLVTPSGAEDTSTSSLTLQKFTRFASEAKDGLNYIFSTVDTATANKVGNSFLFDNITLKQGEPAIQRFIVDGSSKFIIPSSNVDVDTLTVSVQQSVTNTSITSYTKFSNLTELESTSPVYFLEENSDADGNYTLYFGDGILGKQLVNDNIVTIQYLDTNGDAANKVNTFISLDGVTPFTSNIIVKSISAAAGGGMKETIEQVRFRAPYNYTAQNRAVTKNDYEILLLKDYPNIDAISIWSGTDNDPPVYGKVFISLKPKENYQITLIEKERIKKEIIANRSILTVTPDIVDPDYLYFLINAKVNYNPNLTTLDENSIAQLVRQAILDYRDSELKNFNSTFRLSKIQKYIDNAHNSILGSSVSVAVQRRVDITLGSNKNYTIDFNIPLFKGVLQNKFFSYPAITVLDLDGVSREVFIEDTPRSLTGIDSIAVLNPGSGYVSAPTVTISGDGNGATAKAKITNGKITSIEVIDRGTDYTAATVTLISDTGINGAASVNLEAKNGVIRSFYYKSSGEKVVVNANLGTIDYDKGYVSLINLNTSSVLDSRYGTNVLTFGATPVESLVSPLRNRIIDIDDTDSGSVVVAMVPET